MFFFLLFLLLFFFTYSTFYLLMIHVLVSQPSSQPPTSNTSAAPPPFPSPAGQSYPEPSQRPSGRTFGSVPYPVSRLMLVCGVTRLNPS